MSSWPSQRRSSCRPPVRRPFGEDPEFRFNGVAPAEPGKPERVGFHASAATQRAQFKMTRELLGEIGKVSKAPDVWIEIDAETLRPRRRSSDQSGLLVAGASFTCWPMNGST